MSPFKKEIKELKEQMNQLKEYLLQFKEKIENIQAPHNSTRFREVFELFKTLERCCESFNKHQAVPSNTFVIPDDILSPEFSSNDPIKTLHEGLEHLKKIHGVLTEFKSDLENLPDVPRKPKQIIKMFKPQKIQSLRFRSKMLRVESDIEIVPENIVIDHPESPTVVAKSRISIDRDLVGDDYVPFNSAIPDEREINGIIDNDLRSNDYNVPISLVIPDQFTKDQSTLLNHPSISKQITNKASSSGISEVFHHNVPFQPEGVETAPEIQSVPNILQSSSIAEIPAFEQIMDIDQNAMEIMQELSQQKFLRKKAMILLSHSTSSDNIENAQIVSFAPKPLKKTKFRKIPDQLVMLPQDTSTYRISPHFFDFRFNIHVQGVIDGILKIRSNLKPSLKSRITTQASTQQKIDEIQTHHREEPLLTRSQTEVQRVLTNQSHLEKSSNIPYVTIQPDQQSEIHLSTLDYNPEQPSVVLDVAQTSRRSPLPLILIHEGEAVKEKLPDAAYTHFESVLQKNNPNKKATPIKNVKPSSVDTGSKSLRLMSQADLVKNMDHDQYVSFCILREIQRKYSTSNQIDIKSIQKHFSTDRIGFCKLIRTTIDLQCHDLIRIIKNENNNKITGIEIFES